MKSTHFVVVAMLLALTAGTVHAAIAPIQGFWPMKNFGPAADISTGMDAGDVDGDGDIDIVVANDGARNRLYRNKGNGSFQEEDIGTSALKTRDIRLVDMDSDGDLDVITAEGAASGTVSSLLYLNDGTGNFGTPISFESRTAPVYGKSIAAGDIDQDGTKDVVIAYYGYNRICYQGAAITDWTCGNLVGGSNNTAAIAVADVDMDGKPDIITGNANTYNRIIFNNGASSATQVIFGASTDATYALAIGDLNGDNRPDILAGNYNGINHTYRFSSRTTHSVSNLGNFTDPTYGLSAGDIDRDGDLDVFVANNGQVNLVMKNRGSGSFQDSDAVSINDTGESYQLVMADFNGDGWNDLACANGDGADTLLLQKKRMNIALMVASVISRRPVPQTKPAAPGRVTAAARNHTFDINLSWRDNSNNEDRFVIYMSRTNDFSTARQQGTVGANVTSFTARNLNPCTTYYFWVAAVNSVGTVRSTGSAGTTTAPSAPTDLYSTNYIIRSTSLYWSNNSDQCTVRYHVFAKNPNETSYGQISDSGNLTSGTTGATNVGITPETYIFYRVAAENGDGVMGPLSCSVRTGYRNAVADGSSSCKAAVGYAFGDQPKYPWASTGQSDKVTFTWDDVPIVYSSDGSSVATYANCFRVEYKIGTGNWLQHTDCLQNPFTQNNWQYQRFDITGMPADTAATLKISTHYRYDTDGDGTLEDVYADPVFFAGKTLPAGGSGGGLAALGSTPWITASQYYPGKIMVGWTTTSGAARYEVQRASYGIYTGCAGAVYQDRGSFTGNSFNDNVGDWKEYCYRVRACNSGGCTAFSAGEYGNSGGGL